MAEKIGLGQSTIYRMIANGKFPKPFELVPGRTAWIESDIDDWLAERSGKQPAGVSATLTEERATQQMQHQ